MDVFHISFSLSFHLVDIALQLIDQCLNLLLQDLLLLKLLLEQSLALGELLALTAHFYNLLLYFAALQGDLVRLLLLGFSGTSILSSLFFDLFVTVSNLPLLFFNCILLHFQFLNHLLKLFLLYVFLLKEVVLGRCNFLLAIIHLLAHICATLGPTCVHSALNMARLARALAYNTN